MSLLLSAIDRSRSILIASLACLACLGGFDAAAADGITPRPVDSGETLLASTATAVASELLASLQVRGRSNQEANAFWLAHAALGEPLLVHGYDDLEPRYYLLPLDGSGEGRGIVAVDARRERWLWYSLDRRSAAWPPVDAAAAAARSAQWAVEQSLAVDWAEPLVVRLPGKRIGWLCRSQEAGEAIEVFFDLDRADAPLLTSIDGTLAKHVAAHPAPAPETRSGSPSLPRPARSTRHPDFSEIRDIPFHYQVTSWYCGCAAVQMLLDYHGEEIGQVDISDVENDIEYSGTFGSDNRRACHFSGMSAAMQNPNLQGYRERGLGYAGNEAWLYDAPYEHVKDLVSAGVPFEILTWYDGSHSSGHFRVIKGYDAVLGEIIVHDPWYGTPFYGPDLHFEETFLVEDLWLGYTSGWALQTSPWTFSVTAPEEVQPGEAFTLEATVHYPGPGPFAHQHPAIDPSATIELPEGFTLASGSSTIALSVLYSGDSANASWQVIAGTEPGLFAVGLRARGTVAASSYSYSSYVDSIGGTGQHCIEVAGGEEDRWTATTRLSNSSGASSLAFPGGKALVVEPSGVAHLVYSDSDVGNGEVYYRRYGAGAWDPPIRLATSAEWSYNPVLAQTPDGELHVAWTEVNSSGIQTLQYVHGDGATWSAPAQLGIAGQRYHNPSIAADAAGNLHVAWWRQSSSGSAIYYQKWNGSGWETVEYIDGSSAFPAVAADDEGRVFVLYERERGWTGVADIQCRIWEGGTWAPRIAVSDDSSYAHGPAIAIAADGTPHAVWWDGRNATGDIYYSSFDGAAWAAETALELDPADAQYPSICAGLDGSLHVTWQDFREGNGEIYYRCHQGDWLPWERVSRDRHPSALASVGVDAVGQVAVVWVDERDGNPEIYGRVRASLGADAQPPVWVADSRLANVRIGPVPATAQAEVRFRAPTPGPGTLVIVDISGRCVRAFDFTVPRAGTQLRSWDLRDTHGQRVAAGVYFCRLHVPGLEAVRPLVVVGR